MTSGEPASSAPALTPFVVAINSAVVGASLATMLVVIYAVIDERAEVAMFAAFGINVVLFIVWLIHDALWPENSEDV